MNGTAGTTTAAIMEAMANDADEVATLGVVARKSACCDGCSTLPVRGALKARIWTHASGPDSDAGDDRWGRNRSEPSRPNRLRARVIPFNARVGARKTKCGPNPSLGRPSSNEAALPAISQHESRRRGKVQHEQAAMPKAWRQMSTHCKVPLI